MYINGLKLTHLISKFTLKSYYIFVMSFTLNADTAT